MPGSHDGPARLDEPIAMFSDEQLDELLGAYALNAIDDSERVAVDRYLGRSPRARAEVADHLLVASALGSSASDAPVLLWDRIADQLVDKQRQQASTLTSTLTSVAPATSVASSPSVPQVTSTFEKPASVVVPFERRVLNRPRTIAWLSSAAAAVAAIGFLGFQVQQQNTRLTKVTRELAQAESKTFTVESLMASPGTKVADLQAEGGVELARFVLGKDGRGLLVNSSAYHLPKGDVLQLWGVQNDQVISLGVMEDGVKSVPVSAAGKWTKFVLTAEHRGGVVASDGPALAAGAFTA
jgi:anti-sigma factor RsiW